MKGKAQAPEDQDAGRLSAGSSYVVMSRAGGKQINGTRGRMTSPDAARRPRNTELKFAGSPPSPLAHPCGRAAKALDKAGHTYETKRVKGGRLRPWTWTSFGRDRAEVERLSGQRAVPILVLDNGDVIGGSGHIVSWRGRTSLLSPPADTDARPIRPGRPRTSFATGEKTLQPLAEQDFHEQYRACCAGAGASISTVLPVGGRYQATARGEHSGRWYKTGR